MNGKGREEERGTSYNGGGAGTKRKREGEESKLQKKSTAGDLHSSAGRKCAPITICHRVAEWAWCNLDDIFCAVVYSIHLT